MSSWEADPDEYYDEPTSNGGARASYTEGRFRDRGFAVTIESTVDVSNHDFWHYLTCFRLLSWRTN